MAPPAIFGGICAAYADPKVPGFRVFRACGKSIEVYKNVNCLQDFSKWELEYTFKHEELLVGTKLCTTILPNGTGVVFFQCEDCSIAYCFMKNEGPVLVFGGKCETKPKPAKLCGIGAFCVKTVGSGCQIFYQAEDGKCYWCQLDDKCKVVSEPCAIGACAPGSAIHAVSNLITAVFFVEANCNLISQFTWKADQKNFILEGDGVPCADFFKETDRAKNFGIICFEGDKKRDLRVYCYAGNSVTNPKGKPYVELSGDINDECIWIPGAWCFGPACEDEIVSICAVHFASRGHIFVCWQDAKGACCYKWYIGAGKWAGPKEIVRGL